MTLYFSGSDTLIKYAMVKNKCSTVAEKEKKSMWLQLPDELLELIMRYLRLKECLGLRAVCSSWSSTIADAIANKNCNPLPEPPLALLIYYNREIPCSIPKGPLLFQVQGKKVCVGSVEGWMIMCDNFHDMISLSVSIYFLNPVTHARILVPSMLNYPSNSTLGRDQLRISKMVASSKPHCSVACFLVALFNDLSHIAFCRLSDESWTMIETEQGNYFMDVEILGSKLYVIRANTCVVVYDLQDDSDGNPIEPSVLTLLPPVFPPTRAIVLDGCTHQWGNVSYYMVKDEALQELIIVSLHFNAVHDAEHLGYLNMVSEFISPPQIFKMKVFNLCLRNENKSFVQVNNLGDRVLFIGGRKNIVMSSAKVNRNGEELIAGNSIYFAFRHHCPQDPWKGFLLGIFDMVESRIKCYSIEKGESIPPYPTWLVPSLW